MKFIELILQKFQKLQKKYFNCSYIESVELEDYGGEGTAGYLGSKNIIR